ncbi:DUF4360 domain-containing protein [Streptomyces sp. KR80]|uniref:DUF4360 domain-containing protein n=1 Tax=Streptomyces sp. KR80 TaxID=3457426 RepID=UPI003FD5004C
MRKALALLGAVTTVFAATTTAAEATPPFVLADAPSDKIEIELATVNGSGCKKNTTAVAVAPDNTAFTVTYSEYLAQVGVGAKPVDFRKNCQLSLVVHVPQGFTYAIAKVDYRGFAYLEKGATGMEKANYYFQGSQETVPRTHTFDGPYNDNWQASDAIDVAELVWAPCGKKRNFNINTELRVDKGTSDTATTTSFMTMDSTDASVSTIYRFAWKQCTES